MMIWIVLQKYAGYGYHHLSIRRKEIQQETDMEFKHKSVLLEETIDGLNIKPEGIYVDGTLEAQGMQVKYAADFLPRGDLLA